MNKLFLLLPLLLAACTDPVVVIPGGQLSGVVAEAPERWTSVADVVQLETRPSDPYSVNEMEKHSFLLDCATTAQLMLSHKQQSEGALDIVNLGTLLICRLLSILRV